MHSWAEMIFATVTAFVATNVDDILVLMVFFSQRSPSFRTSHIVIGQYLGFCALIGISVIGWVGGIFIPSEWIGLLGFLPIFIAAKRLCQRRAKEPSASVLSSQSGWFGNVIGAPTLSVAGVTLANGGDNIGVYVAFFTNYRAASLAVVIGILLVMVAAWCFLGCRLGRHPFVASVIDRFGHFLVPVVLAGIGVYILNKSGAWVWLIGLVSGL